MNDISIKILFSVEPQVTLETLQVTFHYVGYNESGRRIDSTYLQGSPAKIRMGTNALIPGEKTTSRIYYNLLCLLSRLSIKLPHSPPSTCLSSYHFELKIVHNKGS
jgi:hypothetical protein